MFRIFWDFIYSFIGLIASLVTLTFFVEKLSPTLSADGRLAVIFIGVLFLWFFLENIFLKIRWGRERKYAQTLALLSDGFSGLHKLYRKDGDIQGTIRACEKLCTNLADTYSLITGTNCNVSIKILTWDEDDGNTKLKALTFARSHDPKRNPKENPTKHWLDKNTDFLEIFNQIDTPSSQYFFSNSLPFRFGYQNTSFQVYGGEPDNNVFLRLWRWKLPYKSTIVLPICPVDDQSSNALVGFICVDSPKLGAFKVDYDVPLLEGVADGLYNTIHDISMRESVYFSS